MTVPSINTIGTAASVSTGTLTLTVPTPVAGQYALAMVARDSAYTAAPAGWTLVVYLNNSVSRSTAVYGRVLDGAETTIAITGTNDAAGRIITFDNVDNADPLDLGPAVLTYCSFTDYVASHKGSDIPAGVAARKDVLAVSINQRNYGFTDSMTTAEGFNLDTTASVGADTSSDSYYIAMSTKSINGFDGTAVPTFGGSSGYRWACAFLLRGTPQPNTFRLSQDTAVETYSHSAYPNHDGTGAAYVTGSGSTWSLALPTDWYPGQLAIAAFYVANSASFTQTVPGWTNLGAQSRSSVGTNWLFWKVLDGSDTTGPGGACSSGVQRAGIVTTWSHTNATPIGPEGQDSSARTFVYDTADVTTANTYSALLTSVQYGYVPTTVVSDAGDGFAELARQSIGDRRMMQLIDPRSFGSSTKQGAQLTGSGASGDSPFGWISRTIEVVGLLQPVNVPVSIVQDSTVAPTMTRADGFPIEASIQQESTVAWTGTAKARRRPLPRHAIIYVSDLSGDVKAAIT